MIIPLCPLCGRRASERIGVHTSIRHGRTVRIPSAPCPSPFHDRADHAEEAFDLVSEMADVCCNCCIAIGECIHEKARALLAREGRKEEKDA
jgi:hypothetical protein